ncbi:DUF2062 domain-containing protein [Pontibaca salina]|uniref:DUF2062 domain-containing protein n=1 Tax=Pontibaca salina TaxID=2795731 RepID=A0A934HPP6_9RHOB|nr:DUF2062 domain-containing protein [Pontibaca salina]
MVFRRRDPRTWTRATADFFYPRGGWTRAFHYVKHRLRRLPDSPERIARGIAAGVFTTFTPFYGLHFVIAALAARALRGNILAALMGTFFGNPLTYVPIGVIALKTGHFLSGTRFDERSHRSFGGKFADAWEDLWSNFLAIFTDRVADWRGLHVFYDTIFFPYMIGGTIVGVLAGALTYYLTVPVIRAYKRRRRNLIKKKFEAIKQKAASKGDTGLKAD